VAPFLLGAGAFGLLYGPANRRAHPGRRPGAWAWLGRHSYSLYLTHQPFLALCVPHGTDGGAARVAAGLSAALGLTIASAVALEWCVGPGIARVRRIGARTLSVRLGAAAAVLGTLLISGEMAVRRLDPQEVWGWGERPSLEPHDTFGWRLRPLVVTRLRWQSYDYVVRANALGFPGPNRPEERAPGMLRVLVTGDAYSSAEGVDTERAWPRLLEPELRARTGGRVVEVLNFAITGYGPNQEAAVVREFAPRFRPDIIVVEMFVNDYDDALTSDDAFRDSIGFARPDPRGWFGVLALTDLRDLAKVSLLEPVYARLTGTPAKRGYHLASFPALERDRAELEEGRRIAAARLQQIAGVAKKLGARLVVLLVPAPVQICRPGDLAYWPRGVDLDDTTRFDAERPQRWTAGLAAHVGAEYHDLRDVLRGGLCPYQPRNMHWTAEGHRRVADAVASWLVPAPGGQP
jgi:hypothetical protein